MLIIIKTKTIMECCHLDECTKVSYMLAEIINYFIAVAVVVSK